MKGPEEPDDMADPVHKIKNQLIQNKKQDPDPPHHPDLKKRKPVKECKYPKESGLSQYQENCGKQTEYQIVNSVIPAVDLYMSSDTDKQFNADKNEEKTVGKDVRCIHLIAFDK